MTAATVKTATTASRYSKQSRSSKAPSTEAANTCYEMMPTTRRLQYNCYYYAQDHCYRNYKDYRCYKIQNKDSKLVFLIANIRFLSLYKQRGVAMRKTNSDYWFCYVRDDTTTASNHKMMLQLLTTTR